MIPQPATQWKPMSEPMMFPALILLENGTHYIQNSAGTVVHHAGDCIVRSTHSQPFVPPAAKPRQLDAFELWYSNAGFDGIIVHRAAYKSWAAATEAERARFAAGVEKLGRDYHPFHPASLLKLFNNLRALAKGAA